MKPFPKTILGENCREEPPERVVAQSLDVPGREGTKFRTYVGHDQPRRRSQGVVHPTQGNLRDLIAVAGTVGEPIVKSVLSTVGSCAATGTVGNCEKRLCKLWFTQLD